LEKNPGDALSSQNLSVKVFSALKHFTSEFGMESGSSASLESPGEKKQKLLSHFLSPGNLKRDCQAQKSKERKGIVIP
jgi:hypothetical protein